MASQSVLTTIKAAALNAVAAPFVDLDNVGLRYSEIADAQALSDLRMTVGKGEFAAVVGPSGCGKSSLMKLVTGLVPATSGSVKVAGQLVNGALKIVGMAFQNPTMLPWRNILSNIMLPLEIVQPHRGQLRTKRKEYEAIALSLLDTVGLRGFEKRSPWTLSGGMQQRASLCRSLIHSPQLLMLDEPFGALDAFTREELWAVLQKLWLERQFTCILVTHDLREAAFLADVVHVMSSRPGRIVATHRVDLPRPRSLETTFDAEFVNIVHRIRGEIAKARHESKLGIGPLQGAA